MLNDVGNSSLVSTTIGKSFICLVMIIGHCCVSDNRLKDCDLVDFVQ